jgi:nucleoside-diphosphate-sugar epimerase
MTDTFSAHVVVTGGAGFLGSHLSRALLARGDRVTVVDNFSTGRRASLDGLADKAGFELRDGDVTRPPRWPGCLVSPTWCTWHARRPRRRMPRCR